MADEQEVQEGEGGADEAAPKAPLTPQQIAQALPEVDLKAQDALGVSEEAAPIPWEKLSMARKQAVIEALIHAADRPLAMSDLRELLGSSRWEIAPVLEALKKDMRRPERGVHLVQVAGGYAIRTRAELSPWLKPLVQARPPRLSRAALETLAIIAYRQPVTRGEVEEVRGVDSGGVVRSLLDKRLIRILGRRNDVGRPMIYGTTRDFLKTFGLKDLAALPPLAEIRELLAGAQEKGDEPPEGEAAEDGGAPEEGELSESAAETADAADPPGEA